MGGPGKPGSPGEGPGSWTVRHRLPTPAVDWQGHAVNQHRDERDFDHDPVTQEDAMEKPAGDPSRRRSRRKANEFVVLRKARPLLDRACEFDPRGHRSGRRFRRPVFTDSMAKPNQSGNGSNGRESKGSDVTSSAKIPTS